MILALLEIALKEQRREDQGPSQGKGAHYNRETYTQTGVE
jgi:hypothetical protein